MPNCSSCNKAQSKLNQGKLCRACHKTNENVVNTQADNSNTEDLFSEEFLNKSLMV